MDLVAGKIQAIEQRKTVKRHSSAGFALRWIGSSSKFTLLNSFQTTIVFGRACWFLLVLLLPTATWGDPKQGQRLARIHCASCHEFTDPSILPERSWRYLLPYMGFRMGIDDTSPLEGAGRDVLQMIKRRKKLVRQIGTAPAAPMLSKKQWDLIRDYYLMSAPKSSLPQAKKPEPEGGLDLFQARSTSFNNTQALTSLIHVDEPNQELLVGDSRYQSLTTLTKDLRRISYINTKGFLWLQAHQASNGMHLLSIGDLMGGFANDRLGKINFAVRENTSYKNKGIALTGLHRPSAMAFGDFDMDGMDEVVVTNFGSSRGSVGIYQPKANGWQFEVEPSLVLATEPGAVDCRVSDFNQDGLPDIAVLFSDARENLSIFINLGQGKFERKIIFSKHAAWGFVRFRWIDFDRDGDLDVITVNGDNVDSDPYNTLKPYHGIRLYLNRGDLRFEETFTYPMYGAYGLAVEDFDLDGDFDIAAIAFNPDFKSENREDFVYLENTDGSRFATKRVKFPKSDRWITITAGDIDGDGDKDLFLGGGYLSAGLEVDHPLLMDDMDLNGRALHVLENTTK